MVTTEPATEDTDYRICTVRGINRTTSNRRYRLHNLHRAWYQQNQQQKIQTTESVPCVVSTEQPATGDTDYRTWVVCGINRTTTNRRYRLQNLHRAWYRQNQQQKIQSTQSAPCVVSTEQPATRDTDYRISTVRVINNQQQKTQTTESLLCMYADTEISLSTK